jgi:adenine deaminase
MHVHVFGNAVNKRKEFYSLHDELEHVVKAGLTPLAALQTATINPAKYVGKEKEIGSVTRGKLADLVLLDENPLVDINNTRKINAVVANGRLLQRKDLDKMLEGAKENVKDSNKIITSQQLYWSTFKVVYYIISNLDFHINRITSTYSIGFSCPCK